MGGAEFSPVCLYGGAGISVGIPFCFSPDTKFIVFKNDEEIKKNVSEIKEGDLVLTFEGNQKIYTKVLENKLINSSSPSYRFLLKDPQNDKKTKNIAVTGNHLMLVFRQNNQFSIVQAGKLKIGEILRTDEGMYVISEINRYKGEKCYQFVTESGTALANGVLTTTIYAEKNMRLKMAQKIVDSAKCSLELGN